MDPKENDTQTPPIDDQASQPTAQQKADGELVVSHETEIDPSITNGDAMGSDASLPSTDPNAVAGNVANANGSDVMGTDVGNGIPSDSFSAPEAPAAPIAGQQPTMPPADTAPQAAQPLQPFSQPDQTQQFPPAAPTPTDPGMAPAVPTAPIDPTAPATPPAAADVPTSGAAADPKNRVMILVLVLIAALVILGLGVYALMQL